MRRGGRNPNENPGVRPVERIDLSERSPKTRLIWVISLIVVALISLSIFFFSLREKPGGWTQISPSDTDAGSLTGDFVLYYDLGASGASPTTEYRELSALYGSICREAYTFFHAEEAFEGVGNLHTLNTHPGEEITVSPALYAALAQLEASGSRLLYTAPYFGEYRNLFAMTEDPLAAELDPYRNSETAAHFRELSAYVNSDEHIRVELLGDNRVRLVLSPAYTAFAAACGIRQFVDLYGVKNAFVADYMASRLEDEGFVYGYLSSHDGFTRNLDPRETAYSLSLYARHEGRTYVAATYTYEGRNSIVNLRAFPIGEETYNYYVYANGDIRHPYVDPADGLCRSSVDSLVVHSPEQGCAELLLAMLPVYVADTCNTAALDTMAENGLMSILSDGTSLICRGSDAVTVHEFDGVVFTKTNA